MPSSIVLSDNGASSGSAGIKTSGGNDGLLLLQTTTVGGTATTAVTIDTSQNMGLGVTPSAWGSGFKAIDVNTYGAVASSTSALRLFANSYSDGTNWIYKTTAAASRYELSGGAHYWYNAASGTAGTAITFTQAMTLAASGGLSVGTTTDAGTGNILVPADGKIQGNAASGSGSSSYIELYNSSTGNMTLATRFVTASIAFATGTTPTERARITSSGYFKASNTGSYLSSTGAYHEFISSGNGSDTTTIVNTSAGPYGAYIYFNGASPNNTTNYFINCSDSTNLKAIIYSSGTFGSRTSTYGGVSDIKVKQDIVDASSQWGDIKALRFRKYRFKDDPTGPLQLGLISQEAELVSPGLVFETPDTTTDEEGNRVETGEVTKSVKYSILYMKAVVALQEAMNRIEQLEADVSALKGAK